MYFKKYLASIKLRKKKKKVKLEYDAKKIIILTKNYGIIVLYISMEENYIFNINKNYYKKANFRPFYKY